MKRIIILFTIILSSVCMAQKTDLVNLWNTIEKNYKAGELKSLQPQIAMAIEEARNQKNYPLLVKGLFYDAKIKVATSDEEDDVNFVFENFSQEVAKNKGVEHDILKAFLAKLYQLYYQENQWKVQSRTNTEAQTSEDVRYWTAENFTKKIDALYQEIIDNRRMLQAEKSEKWTGFLEDSKQLTQVSLKENLEIMPTLFDIIMQDYVQYLDEQNDDEKAQKILLMLSNYHAQHQHQSAFLYNEERLLNLKRSTTGDEQFFDSLEKLAEKYPSNWYTAEIYGHLVSFLFSTSTDDKALKAQRDLRILKIYEKMKSNFSGTAAFKNVQEHANFVKLSEIRVQTEQFILPNQVSPIKIKHRNVARVYVRILDYNIGVNDLDARDLDEAFSGKYKDSKKRYELFLANHKTIQEYSIELKAFADHQFHSALYPLRALPKGRYVLLVSNQPNFSYDEKSPIAYAELKVTDKAILNNDNQNLRVVGRNDGENLSNQTVEFYEMRYDFKKGKNQYNLVKTLTTDAKGMGQLDRTNQYFYRLADEQVFYRSYFNRKKPERIEKPVNFLKIFTDRAIYRPGQTVYFKGILTNSFNKEVTVIPNQNVTISLRDVNGKTLQELDLTTNEFGSVHGELILPSSALTGNFSIQSNYSTYHNIRVEEYKRPKFQVEIDKPKQVYRLEDEVKVSGKAIAFSGANIDNAKVEYRVFRQAIYPFYFWGRRPAPQFEAEQEITFGTLTTDKDGKFEFDFKAIPARNKQDKKDLRTYVYRIETSVTDINGETQFGASSIRVGDQSIVLSTNIASSTKVEDLKEIEVVVKNLNDQDLSKEGQLSVTKLQAPTRVLRDSPFSTDYEAFSQSAFEKLFPHEPFGKENLPEQWEKGQLVFQTNFDTSKTSKITIPNATKWQEGYYLVEMKTNEKGEEVANAQLVYIKNEQNYDPQTLLTYELNQPKYKVNDLAKVSFRTKAKQVEVLVRLEADGKMIKEELLKVTPKGAVFQFPIEENYQSNAFVHYQMVKYNSKVEGGVSIEIPFDDKKLQITTSSFRDKLTPGAKEKWTITVKGNQKDALLAEVLSTMYDASLDQFEGHSLDYFPYNFRRYARYALRDTGGGFDLKNSSSVFDNNMGLNTDAIYPLLGLNSYNFSFESYNYHAEFYLRHIQPEAELTRFPTEVANAKMAVGATSTFDDEIMMEEIAEDESNLEAVEPKLNAVQARKSLQETAFFYPNLRTDKDGNVSFEFTVPESLTEWKFMTLAHTPDMKTAYQEWRTKTQKELMVVPNLPRFLREGDQIKISTKLVNLSERSLSGQAKLMLFDAVTNQALDAAFDNLQAVKNFTTAKGESGEVNWTIKVPQNIQAVSYRIVASAGDFSDGEESVLPVVTNRMLVTETLPLHIRENQNKTFVLDKLLQGKSNSLSNFTYTFEMTTNPIWYAIFSLPYLREYPYECSEQVFSRLYGNLISENIISSNPKIKAVFDDWNRKGQLKSKLELNEELKAILLEETPWVRNAVNEEEQMKRIAVLFDLNRMQLEMQSAFQKLSQKQKASGGFSWFEGGYENDYITTHIVSGFGNLKKMGIDFRKYNIDIQPLLSKAIHYLDQQQIRYYNQQKNLKKNELDYANGIHYLYARSFFLDQNPIPKELKALQEIYFQNIEKSAKELSLQTQAMAALALYRFGKPNEAQRIVKTLKEKVVESDEMGMYWKENRVGWFWYNTPVETQAVLIEAFDEVLKDQVSVESMKVWLLKNRQTNQWHSTKATTKAVYALMNTGKSWMDAEKGITVKIADKPIDLETPNAQAGSGYVKHVWTKEEISPEMGRVEVNKTSAGVAWGAVYWQYFEDLDKITSAETGIKFNKKLFVKQNTASGPLLKEIISESAIKVGDIVTVRLEISLDRDMQFVHIKDMRAAGFEPVNVLSGYRWNGEFGYYESTRDLATNFFADFMRKGIYVFEYDLKANNAGTFSNGITSMQNMYAPELSAHSEGVRVEIK